MMIVQPVSPAPASSSTTRSSVVIRDRLARGRTGPLDVVLLDAPMFPALVSLRELGRAGLAVGAAASVPDVPAFASRWCLVSAILPDFAAHPQGFGDGLLSLLEHHPARVLIPTSAASVAQLHALRPLVEHQSALALAGDNALAMAMDTERTYDLAQGLGILIPRRAQVRVWNDLKRGLREVGLPAVVRSVGGIVDHRAITVRSEDEAWRAAEALAETGADVVIEQWLPGPRETVSLLVTRDRVWARFAHVARRMLPGRDDLPIVRESIALPVDTAHETQRLVRALDLHGFAEVVFRRDREGRPVLIEVLPYLTDTIELAARAGINFPRLVFAWAAREQLWSVPEYRVGVRQHWLTGDLQVLKAAFARPAIPGADAPGRALATLLLNGLRPSAYDTIDWRDVGPTIAATAHLIKRNFQHGRSSTASLAASDHRPTIVPRAAAREGATAPVGSEVS